jgi:hypothetical protein
MLQGGVSRVGCAEENALNQLLNSITHAVEHQINGDGNGAIQQETAFSLPEISD